ncbi:hypothetical protein GH808_07155 [Acetobacterium fimetarium]|uniref:Uncharacterized protein n=1 Tax=Acetobacterium fimetarium TaxID=52691 RepID=A0ABR6WUD8_9FIRM|nr:hypothetical protein [Acetobacterium fimetarium]MBC3804212.1 hypothetical protein [Acetobacterium fimetarium]
MVITWNEIIELNDRVRENNLDYKIHLSDACGGQSMWIESLKADNSFEDLDVLNKLIEDYFTEIKAEIVYSWDKKSFWMKDRSF